MSIDKDNFILIKPKLILSSIKTYLLLAAISSN